MIPISLVRNLQYQHMPPNMPSGHPKVCLRIDGVQNTLIPDAWIGHQADLAADVPDFDWSIGHKWVMVSQLLPWLVVYPPLWKIWKSVGIIIPNIWKNKNHVPNHQPVPVWIKFSMWRGVWKFTDTCSVMWDNWFHPSHPHNCKGAAFLSGVGLPQLLCPWICSCLNGSCNTHVVIGLYRPTHIPHPKRAGGCGKDSFCRRVGFLEPKWHPITPAFCPAQKPAVFVSRHLQCYVG